MYNEKMSYEMKITQINVFEYILQQKFKFVIDCLTKFEGNENKLRSRLKIAIVSVAECFHIFCWGEKC